MKNNPIPILTVDIVLLTILHDELHVALAKRNAEPYEGSYALPGGYVRTDEDTDTKATALRVLRQKANLDNVYCEQLATFSGSQRDPRGWSATVAYYALMPADTHSSKKGSLLNWHPTNKLDPLPFDHNKIIDTALERIKNKGAYSNLPAFLLPKSFTFSQLRTVYEQTMETELNDSSFRRKIEELGIIKRVKGKSSKASARPAQLYQLKQGTLHAFNRKI